MFQGLECTEFPDALRAKRHSGGWRDVRLAAGHLKGPGSYSASMLRSTRVGIPTTSIFCPTSPR